MIRSSALVPVSQVYERSGAPRRGRERSPVFGWSFYDFANSPFPTVVVGALLPVYFEEHVMGGGTVGFLGGQWSAESLWGLVVAVGPLIMSLSMPVLGAVA